MKRDNLSQRLQTVADFVPSGVVLADIGSDHAYLPCYLMLQGKLAKGVAGEVNDGPYHSALKEVKEAGFEESIAVRKGDGLAVIRENEVDVVTICGMGGQLITSILEAGKDQLVGVSRLILQPNVGGETIRKWLHREGWTLVAERIMKEDGKIYEVLVADFGQDGTLYEENAAQKLLLGPYLMQEKNDAFREKWTLEMEQWTRILQQMKDGRSAEIEERKQVITKKIAAVQEVLA
ncbi:hypothetical protein A374_10665 [Fictibacillus macauensis ZFHKF-1]|uniref:SAM-dependent methyltransferase n=1 Tax=Fictibacillus macauensis ZFHKF-1 TaxID=1196324 RepID=I8AIA2_9BACL|nr:tRNA (adenine(22)-N(1))-methyltransferase TrmK [Fictibacillus macauensis]EIT85199.1 hypothetical protein A374_10665 [Fictibacillus macauensis ZFHKF-1]